MKHTLEEINISHVTTSYYHPQGDSKIEQFHWTSQNVIWKKVSASHDTSDIYLNQGLAAIRLSINDSTKFCPFYILYNCDTVLPIDNTLKPRKRYLEEEPYKIGLKQQHTNRMVHQHLKKAWRKQARYVDKNSEYTEFQVGDPVYLKQQQCKYKLQGRWYPYYRIIEKTTPVTSCL